MCGGGGVYVCGGLRARGHAGPALCPATVPTLQVLGAPSLLCFALLHRLDLVIVDARGVTALFNLGGLSFGDAQTLLDDTQSLFPATHSHFRMDFMDVDGDGACGWVSVGCPCLSPLPHPSTPASVDQINPGACCWLWVFGPFSHPQFRPSCPPPCPPRAAHNRTHWLFGVHPCVLPHSTGQETWM